MFFLKSKKNKYSNKKVTFNNIKFDSAGEMRRYSELRLLEKGGVIRDLVTQPRFSLQESFKHNGKTERRIDYVADFSYEKKVDGKWVSIVEDFKGYRTEIYKLKRKLFLYKFRDKFEFIESGSK